MARPMLFATANRLFPGRPTRPAVCGQGLCPVASAVPSGRGVSHLTRRQKGRKALQRRPARFRNAARKLPRGLRPAADRPVRHQGAGIDARNPCKGPLPWQLLGCCGPGPGHGHLCVLLGRHAGHADGTDNLAIDNDCTPPSSANMLRTESRRRPAPPSATTSCIALPGRRKSSAVRALPIAISTEPVCVLSSFCSMMSDPVVSRIRAGRSAACVLFAAKIPPPPAPVTLVRHDFSATRSASNRGNLRSCRPRSPLCRKDRANHQSNSQSTRRYPSRSPDIPRANVGTPLGVCHRRIRPSGANDPA